MIKKNDDHIYRSWRKFEAYQIPMTEQGEMNAHLRWEAFKTAWLQAEQLTQKPIAYAYVKENGVGQLCWTKRDASLFKDLLEGWKEIPLYTKEKNHE